jgi:hypothetical protein
MRAIHVLTGAFVTLFVLVVWAFLQPAPPETAPTVHPVVSSMFASGVPPSRGAQMLVLVGALACVTVLGSAVLLASPRMTTRDRWLTVAFWLAYGGVFAGMFLSQWQYEAEGPGRLVLGFTPPTAFLLFGVWLFPAVWLPVLMRGFGVWYYAPEDDARFREIVAEHGVDRHTRADDAGETGTGTGGTPE